MFTDALRCTHNGTGGVGAITLAAVTGYPQFTNALGTSGTLFVDYQISEYTDSTLGVLKSYEAGIGSLALSTNVLTRTLPDCTWLSSGPTYNQINPTALAFGNTAANFVITFGGSSNTQKRGLSAAFSMVGDVWQPFNTRVTYDGNSSTWPLTNGTHLYIPIEYVYTKPITQVAVEVTTATAGTNLRMGLYDTDTATGGPVNLLTEFTSTAPIATTATGFRAVAMAQPFWVPPGFYWLCLQSDNSTVAVRRLSHFGSGLISSASGRDIMMVDKGGSSYGPLLAVAETAISNPYTRSGGGQVSGFFK